MIYSKMNLTNNLAKIWPQLLGVGEVYYKVWTFDSPVSIPRGNPELHI